MNTSPNKFKVEVLIVGGVKPEEGVIWMFYPMGRSMFITKHPELYENQSGIVVPTFEEEVLGRFMLADGVENVLKQGKPAPSTYLADVLRTHQAGYLREYVWWYLGQPTWPKDQQPANLLPFMVWANGNLRNHVVQTYGGVKIVRDQSEGGNRIEGEQRTIDVQSGGGSELNSQATAIQSAIQSWNHSEAARLLADFSVAVRALRTDSDATYACFRSQRQLNYFVAGHPEVKKLKVLDWCVGWGSFLKAILASRSQQFADALQDVEAVIELAPLFAHAQAEKGFILIKLRRAKEALESYTRAWDLVARHPENVDRAGPALRGMAVALVELGELDRAEKLLLDSLTIDPGSGVAKTELAYIEQRRSGQASKFLTVLTAHDGAHKRLACFGLKVYRGRYYGPWPGIGIELEQQPSQPNVLTEEAFQSLTQSGRVTRLCVAHGKWSNGASKYLEKLQHLRQLDLNNTEFSDSDVKFIHELPELRGLNLFRTKISDEALSLLAKTPKLEQLFLGQTAVSATGLAQLSHCASLRYLDLEGCVLADDMLIALGKLTGLEGLNLAAGAEQISDRGVEALLNLVNLQLLGFVQPPAVTEEMTRRLRTLPKLKNILPGGCASIFKSHDPVCQADEPLS